MTASDQTYSERQAEQFRRFMRWTKTEGGVEGMTHLATMMQPKQRSRMEWLREHCLGTIMEAGCNWGLVLAWCHGQAGMDISDRNIELARLLAPGLDFRVGDVCNIPWDDQSFDTVILPDVLEHLDWPNGVERAVQEAKRVAHKRVLITMPYGQRDNPDACCFKHAWLLDDLYAEKLIQMIKEGGWRTFHAVKDGFWLAGGDR